MNAQPADFAATESLLAFWRDAGVDACYLDAPVDRTHVEPTPALKALARATASVSTLPIAAPQAAEAASEARKLAAGAETLEALEAAIAGFDGCILKTLGARRAVFGRGDPRAPILVIGEGPGEEEEQSGAPFAGPAGRLLDRMLAAAGLSDKVFISHTVFWRPPGNRPPTPQEQSACLPFLERAMALMQPKAVLLLGASAAKGVLQTDEGIMRLRGQWREWRLAEGGVTAPAVATFHPAFLLRQPQAKAQAWADILSLAARIGG